MRRFGSGKVLSTVSALCLLDAHSSRVDVDIKRLPVRPTKSRRCVRHRCCRLGPEQRLPGAVPTVATIDRHIRRTVGRT